MEGARFFASNLSAFRAGLELPPSGLGPAEELLGRPSGRSPVSERPNLRRPSKLFQSRPYKPDVLPLDYLATAHRDGESNPALRVEGPVSSPLDHRGIGGRGATRTPKGWRLYLFSGQAPHPAGSLPRPLAGALGGDRTHDLVPTKDALCMAELQGHRLAGTTRTCGLPLRRAVLSVLLSYGEAASTAGVEPAPSGFVDRRLDPFGHVDRNTHGNVGGRRRRDSHPRPPA